MKKITDNKTNTVIESFEDIYQKTKIHGWVVQYVDELRPFPLDNIRSTRIKLNKSVNILIEKNNSEIVVDCPDLDLYGVGDSLQEAIMDLSENIEELYFTLKKSGPSKLGPHMLNIWEFLKSIVSEINAIKNKRGRKNL